ncbi:GNAT family N-acetyltransferase [Roseivirga sp.]|uniref:GNAT family N-acetyltransferase n=1 Tax=Roseivirga sp. TaxID=1964215 RepID=UPI003B8E84EA
MTEIKVSRNTSLNETELTVIMGLWNQEYPKQLSFKEIDHFKQYLKDLSNPIHYLVRNKAKTICAWAFTFDRDRERWFAIIVNHQVQGHGIGSHLLTTIKKDAERLVGWVIDGDNYIKNGGMTYKSPLAFYLKNGFEVLPNERLTNEKISAVKISYSS